MITGELRLWRRSMAAQGMSDRTITERLRIMAQLANELGVSTASLTGDAVEDWMSHKRIANSSRATYLGAVRAYSAWARDRHLCDEDLTALIPSPRVPRGKPRPLSTEQVALALQTARRRKMRAMVMLAAFEGLRVSEIAAMRGDDIDWTARTLTTIGKGAKPRDLPLHPDLALHALSMPGSGWWFPSPKAGTGHVAGRSVSDVVSRHLHAHGIHGSAHQLRHWFATTLVQSDTNLLVVQGLMGHESPATTAIYVEVDMASARGAIDRLPRAASLAAAS